jgi:cell division protease FtsH
MPSNSPQTRADHPEPRGDGSPPHHRHWGWVLGIAVIAGLLLINYAASQSALQSGSRFQIPYRPTFVKQVVNGNVSDVSSQGSAIQADLRRPVTYQGHTGTQIATFVPMFANLDRLSAALAKHHVTVNAKPVRNGPSPWLSLLLGFGPTILLIAVFAWFLRRSAGSQGRGAANLTGMTRSKARRAEAKQVTVTFDDVAGIDEAKQELAEIVEFLRDPTRFTRLGGRMPRGVLLSGAPGTGKTLLARAVAGQAGVPFFQMSASEFVEMIVGVGAARVRDLFQRVKKEAPAIVFIDELDAVGRSRGAAANISGGHDEREQTLNQILTEMDGFTGAENVIVLAATNRPEILDPALLRPGRFDRRLTINPPDSTGRRQILDVHVRNVPLADDVDLEAVAAATPGMVGADLANLVNEAALLAARRDHTAVHQADFSDALEKIVLGSERRIVLSAEDRRRTAYHEAGHALVGMLTPGADPVRKISIVPRGHALGVTFQSPEADRYSYSVSYLRGRIAGMLAGRAAEELVYSDITTGAENDLEQATGIARQMVGRWGMSEKVGAMSVLPDPRREQPFSLGGDSISPSTRELVETEARRILDQSHEQALETLQANRHRLDALVEALLRAETLDAADAYRAAGLTSPAEPKLADQAVDAVTPS